MNKFLVLLVTATVLLWGVFLFKMSGNVDSLKTKDERTLLEEFSGSGPKDIGNRPGFKEILARLKPQEMPEEGARDPFRLPASMTPPVTRTAKVPAPPVAAAEPPPPPPKPPQITLDAVLPGDNAVAIIKYRGESAVVSVGQEIWDVVVESIEPERVVLRFVGGTFEIR